MDYNGIKKQLAELHNSVIDVKEFIKQHTEEEEDKDLWTGSEEEEQSEEEEEDDKSVISATSVSEAEEEEEEEEKVNILENVVAKTLVQFTEYCESIKTPTEVSVVDAVAEVVAEKEIETEKEVTQQPDVYEDTIEVHGKTYIFDKEIKGYRPLDYSDNLMCVTPDKKRIKT